VVFHVRVPFWPGANSVVPTSGRSVAPPGVVVSSFFPPFVEPGERVPPLVCPEPDRAPPLELLLDLPPGDARCPPHQP